MFSRLFPIWLSTAESNQKEKNIHIRFRLPRKGNEKLA
jgi:hypothetical protein